MDLCTGLDDHVKIQPIRGRVYEHVRIGKAFIDDGHERSRQ